MLLPQPDSPTSTTNSFAEISRSMSVSVGSSAPGYAKPNCLSLDAYGVGLRHHAASTSP